MLQVLWVDVKIYTAQFNLLSPLNFGEVDYYTTEFDSDFLAAMVDKKCTVTWNKYTQNNPFSNK